ncbi:MAG: thiamine phosphate synthase [Deferribacteraceae bacterium]|jgi:thiamine-phosphate pyrophosphorylase|nr:thiamine phosphate synthase [Deferribacteraceae bacterium]
MDIRRCLKLYLVLETSVLRIPLDDFIMQVTDGGVTAIQLRDKTHSAARRFAAAKYIKPLIDKKDTLFIINNNADIAVAVGAHGVHLGPDDLPPAIVKKYFPGLYVGVSCNNNDDCAAANESGADYAGAGPVFFSATKTDLRTVLEPEGVKNITEKLNMPTIAIGGINAENAVTLKNCGVVGIAVSAAICRSETPYETVQALRRFYL